MKVKLIYTSELNGDMHGACIYWVTPPVIYLAKEIKNTPTGAIVLKHELQHLKFYRLRKKYPNHAKFIMFCNDLYDFMYIFYRLFLRFFRLL